MGKLDGKVAFITGAARGQGRSHAIRLAAEGADIIAVDICAQIDTIRYPMSTPEDLEQTVKEVESLGRRIVACQADVRDRSELKDAFERGLTELGRVDIVVANAGIVPLYIGEEDGETFDDTIAVNLVGVWNTVEAAKATLVAQGDGGAIVLISSTAGLKGGASHLPGPGYTASKHGVVGLMRNYALKLAKHRIRVNSVHPTGVATPMVLNEQMGEILAAVAMEGGQQNPMPVELVESEDISAAVLFLVSEDARYVTGVALPVDAGFCVG
ncbi:MAG: Short-chain dehydrogenase/reductase [Ilumatobacteraceae bacterium]|nr:Short-chain dehydrogenase/reductase [Ilumatobacteraceae bacterium]MCU1386746.1 Short-chain dehydrogenase/reductase [Ilumatobacteraceae bacterium]